jgi:hypothetical protein
MNRAMATAASLLLLAHMPVLAEGGTVFPLAFRELPFTHPLVKAGGRFAVGSGVTPRQVVSVPPEFAVGATFFEVSVAGRDVVFAHERGNPARLFADTDGDGDLSEEEPIPVLTPIGEEAGGQDESTGSFGAIKLGLDSGTAEATVLVQAVLRSQGTEEELVLYPAGAMSGEVLFGGRTQVVAMADCDLDGRYDGFAELSTSTPDEFKPRSKDVLGIDVNGDGELGGRFYETPEMLHLPRLVRVGEAYYRLKPSPDGSVLRIAEDSPALGTLELLGRSGKATFVSDNGYYELGTDGVHELPVGLYRATSVEFTDCGPEDTEWSLRSFWEVGGLGCIEVKEGEASRLTIGPPLRADVCAGDGGGEALSLRVSLHDEQGAAYFVRKGAEGVLQVPRVQVFSADGNLLVSPVGEGSWGVSYAYRCELPGDATDPLHVVVDADIGPFGHVAHGEWLTPVGSIHDAARAGDVEAVRSLLELGVSVDHRDRVGRSPLHWAARHQRRELARFLMGKGATVDACDVFGRTPLYYATYRHDEELMALLGPSGLYEALMGVVRPSGP